MRQYGLFFKEIENLLKGGEFEFACCVLDGEDNTGGGAIGNDVGEVATGSKGFFAHRCVEFDGLGILKEVDAWCLGFVENFSLFINGKGIDDEHGGRCFNVDFEKGILGDGFLNDRKEEVSFLHHGRLSSDGDIKGGEHGAFVFLGVESSKSEEEKKKCFHNGGCGILVQMEG